MRREISGEKWLPDLVGPLLYLMPLMGIVFGDILPKGWEHFCAHFSFEVGDGFTLFFWHERWCEEAHLRELFPALFVLALNRDASVADYQERVSDVDTWSPIFV